MDGRRKPKNVRAEARRPLVGKSREDPESKVSEVERRLADAQQRAAEAQEQQTATAAILSAISSSPTDVQRIFDLIVASACRLCDGVFANAVWFDGELMHNMADHGFGLEAREVLRRAFPLRPTPETMSGRAILAGNVVQSEDMSIDDETTISHRLSRLMGFRAQVSVPMVRNGVQIGAIMVARREQGLFPPRLVELLKTFADQAVIAIENVRLFNETKEALEQPTATADIVRVISRSPTDLMSVFDVILANACRLCEANLAGLWRVSENHLVGIASYNASPEFAERMRSTPLVPSRHGPHDRFRGLPRQRRERAGSHAYAERSWPP